MACIADHCANVRKQCRCCAVKALSAREYCERSCFVVYVFKNNKAIHLIQILKKLAEL